jgi:photosystem II stability/assembly factor-like uncharacterized protein
MKIRISLFSFIIVLISCSSLLSQSWVIQQSGTNKILYESHFFNPNSGWIVGENIAMNTSNGGANWVVQLVPTLYNYAGIQFLSTSTGWIAGGYGTVSGILLKTTDGGLSWTTLFNSSNLLWDVLFLNSNTGFICGNANYFAKTTNAGINWVQKIINTNSGEFYQVAFPDSLTAYLVGSHNKIYKSTNSGENWIQQNAIASAYFRDVYFLNVLTGFAVGSSGVIVKTTNGGDNWIQKTSNVNSYLFSVQFTQMGTGWVAGWDSTLLRSTDNGETWVKINGLPGNYQLTNVNFINQNTGWLFGYNGIILKTANGGVGLYAPLLIYPANNSIVYTTTPGLTWQTVTGALNYFVQISPTSSFITLTDYAYVNSNQYVVPAGKLIGGNTYYWRVKALAGTVESPWSVIWNFYVQPSAVITISSEIPKEYTLEQNYPNPFNPSTKIRFGIKEKGNLNISVYDANGKSIKSEIKNSVSPGFYEYNLNMENYSSGVYYFSYSVNGVRKTIKVLLVK